MPLLFLIGTVVIGSTILIASRLDSLRSERKLDSLWSRESIFLVNNLLLVGLASVILYGTFFPLLAELAGKDASIGAPWFDRFATPLAIGLVFFMGIGPLVAWRRISLAGMRRALGIPISATIVLAVVLALTIGASHSPTAYILFLGGGFTVTAIAQEVIRGTIARRSLAGGSYLSALSSLFTRNRRRYGGYVVHIGLVVALFGIAASSSFQTSRDLVMSPGDVEQVGDYTVTYKQPTTSIDASRNMLGLGAVLTVDARRQARHDPDPVARLLRRPERRSEHADPQLLRGGADERGRPRRERDARPVERDAARPELVRQPDRPLRRRLRRSVQALPGGRRQQPGGAGQDLAPSRAFRSGRSPTGT